MSNVTGEMTLVPGDPLAHRALESLLRAEASVRRRLSADLEREGLSAAGFSVLVALVADDGELEHRRVAYDHGAAAAAVRERFSGDWADTVARRIELARSDVE